MYYTGPSCPENMQDPIQIWPRLAGKHWPEVGRMILAHRLAFRPDPFGQNLTRNQPELNHIWAGFAQYFLGRLWKNGTESQSGKLVAGRLHPARNWA